MRLHVSRLRNSRQLTSLKMAFVVLDGKRECRLDEVYGYDVHNIFRAFMLAYVEGSISGSKRARSGTSSYDEEVLLRDI